jgi:hypothetical protein
MNFSINASISHKVGFTLSEVNSNESLSLSDSNTVSSTYTYGSGSNLIVNAVSITGALPSGGRAIIDLYSIPQTTFRTTQNVVFTGVKNFTVFNTSTSQGYDLIVRATGSNSCTNLFNAGSGNLVVKPYSVHTYNDPYSGFIVSTGQRFVQLIDRGSGASYKVFVLGMSSG